ncbi:eCIS core domain-containing protein [Sorangium sp. So ce542]|uniref:eCIS core domain-containing protein n=1 Tax=Sorangium sp. So ce542 TaxID=3133316 RepID=UPI003F60C906
MDAQRTLGNQVLAEVLGAQAKPMARAKLSVGSTDDDARHMPQGLADRAAAWPSQAGAPVEPGRGALVAAAELPAHSTSTPCRAPAPAALQDRLASRGGAPLPNDEQSRLESRVGASLADVRIHHDDEAHRMAKAVAANAFTAGRHIVFRAGQYQPGTAAGRALLDHEVGHLPDALADGAHVYRAPRFDTDRVPVTSTPPPPRSITVAHFRQQLASRTTGANPPITSFTIVGATTPEQEIFLLNLVWHLGTRDRWDSVIQLQAQIGWEQPASAPSSVPAGGGGRGTVSGALIPTGVVRFSIDAQGAARAELLSPVVQPGAADLITDPRATVESQLQTVFGIARIEDGSASWSEQELQDVLGAFRLLPQGDRAALQGVVLRREATIPPGLAGEFDSGSGSVDEAGNLRPAVPTLRLANSAFASTQTVLGPSDAVLPTRFMTILHEVGHAVASQARRAASARELRAFQANNRAVAGMESARQRWSDAHAGYRAGTTSAADVRARQAEYNTRRSAYVSARAAANRATAARVATEIPAAQATALQTAATNAERDFRRALAAATATAGAYTAAQTTESAGYRDAIAAMVRALEGYRDARSHASDIIREDAITTAQTARNTERSALQRRSPTHAALGDFAPVDTALDQWWEALRMSRNADHQPLRVQRFVEHVTRNGITPLTTYARRSWPHRPEEFFAETYALWRTDPAALRTHYPLLYEYFESGTYLR